MRACPNCGREIAGEFAFCPHCGAALTTGAVARRKTVTAVFCDLSGSTSLGDSLDPEAVRELLTSYFDRMKSIVERHGGNVEKFIGDAVVGAFGVPVAHEDDALRAVRAAEEMRDALPGLGVQARIGVNTGEVVTGSEARPMTGDAMNVAARLEQAAAPGEVLIGRPTLELVRAATEVEPLDPLIVKGKAEPVPAFRLVRVLDAPERRHDLAFVGREPEIAALRAASESASRGRRCELVTVIGEAGVGKSRLVREFLLDEEARVVRGRCLPYGEGITYGPVVDVLKQVDAMPSDEAAESAIRSVLGMSGETASADDIAWAVRKTFEVAAQGLLVVVFDDIQWGETTFLDLIDHVALLSSNAPILLVCMARPELLERRPTWPVTLRLEPLADAEIERLVGERVSRAVRARIVRAAGGNPLFVDEMLALADDADAEVVVPPNLHALLTSRLDQLDHSDRGILEVAAVEGEIFHRGAVQNLVADGAQVMPRLTSLVRAGLFTPHEPQISGEDAFRFRHVLIRDAAYEAMSKADRGDVHRRFAAWLEQRAPDLTELDELVGYHLEQAFHYRAELGLADDDGLGGAASQRLIRAGRRAYIRGDDPASIVLLGRAAAMVPNGVIDLLLETTLVDALIGAGGGTEGQLRAEAMAERAAASGDRIAEMCGKVLAGMCRMAREPEGATEEVAGSVEEAMPVFEQAGSDVCLVVAFMALGEVEMTRGRAAAMADAMDHAAAHARTIGLPPELFGWRASGRLEGPTPVSEALEWLDEQEAHARSNPLLRMFRAQALAMLGRFDEARELSAGARADLADRGAGIELGGMIGLHWSEVERLAGDQVAAAELAQEGCRLLDELGEHGRQSTAAAYAAQALYACDRLDEAERLARRAADLGASDDAWTQMLWRQAEAKVLARRGEHDEAVQLAREAAAISEQTDATDSQAWAYADLGEVLALGGHRDEAAGMMERALLRYERKGNIVMAERTRDRLSALRYGIRT